MENFQIKSGALSPACIPFWHIFNRKFKTGKISTKVYNTVYIV